MMIYPRPHRQKIQAPGSRMHKHWRFQPKDAARNTPLRENLTDSEKLKKRLRQAELGEAAPPINRAATIL